MSESSDNPDDPEMIEKLEAWLNGYVAGDQTQKPDPELLAWLIKHRPDIARVLRGLIKAPKVLARATFLLEGVPGRIDPSLN